MTDNGIRLYIIRLIVIRLITVLCACAKVKCFLDMLATGFLLIALSIVYGLRLYGSNNYPNFYENFDKINCINKYNFEKLVFNFLELCPFNKTRTIFILYYHKNKNKK